MKISKAVTSIQLCFDLMGDAIVSVTVKAQRTSSRLKNPFKYQI